MATGRRKPDEGRLVGRLAERGEEAVNRLTLPDQVQRPTVGRFNFQDIPVRSVLQLIAEESNLNIVAADTVTGNVTLRLVNVPWDQALEIVLRAKGLDMRREGNVMFVAPAAEIAAREKELLTARQQVQQLAPKATSRGSRRRRNWPTTSRRSTPPASSSRTPAR